MFNQWQSNPETYNHLVDYIENMFLAIVGQSKDEFILPFFKTVYADGTPMHDGNPIFSVKHRLTPNIIKIIIDDSDDEQCFETNFDKMTLWVIKISVDDLDNLEPLMRRWFDKLA